ncbi:hypothetical protein LSAT2_014859 [Lamellibrachia satsuma]|nr:hypothetical protein LSAT2_014859 [Lamellibrachia satsuma]
MECNGTSWGRVPRTGCAVINCPRLYTLEKATVNSTERNYNNIVKITCDPGYTFKTGNSFTTRCNESAKWSGMPQKCERLNCGAPPVVHYSSILANVDTHYGSFVTVTCLLGYWVRPGVFSRDVTCTEEGVWEPPLSHCHVVTCTAWATWSGVVVDNSKQRRAGTVVNVSCAADKMFPDSEPYKMTTCGPRGGWLPAVPDCVYRTVPPRFVPKLKEATKSRLIGTLAIALVATLLVVMVALDVATLIYGHGDLKTKRRHDCRKPLRPLLGKTRLFWGRK